SRARIAESRERGEAEYAEVSQGAEQSYRNSTNLRIRAAQHTETIWRSSADERLACQRLHSQISCVRQPRQRNDRGDHIKNGSKSRYGHLVTTFPLAPHRYWHEGIPLSNLPAPLAIID